MSPIFTTILAVMVILAICDLIVGVSNDAINFLNSALGSKVASFRTIMIVAACGILVGVVTSHGMMEVARTGVFHPEHFTLSSVMWLYAAVMLTDVVLLDAFNKLGLPTSTTVSMIFELLGASVAVSLFTIHGSDTLSLSDFGDMINGGRALGMISAILVSVVLSFIVGAIIMWISRAIFSFRYAKAFKRYGALWCAVAIVGILYFALFKGLKSSGLITPEISDAINGNIWTVLLVAWVVSAAVLWVLQLLKVSILKVTILAGTFALALAFAGNDLVNFIGVPMATLSSYQIGEAAGGDSNILMTALAEGQPVDTLYLIAAGVVMVLTLFLSKDAMRVSQTELTLASQHDEEERFNSNAFARSVVRFSVNMNNWYKRVMPDSVVDAINARFVPLSEEERGKTNYDLIRAVVNLAASSILICVGTSFGLPLSTTYVTFIVAMGSSLADRSWGRDSAVYRISGVVTVIMGWFVTALIAFTASFCIGLLLMWGHAWAFVPIVLLAAYILLRRLFKKKRTAAEVAKPDEFVKPDEAPEDILVSCSTAVCDVMDRISRTYNHMLVSLFTENRKELRESVMQSEDLYHECNTAKYSVIHVIKKLEDQNIETAHFYVQVVDYMCEVSKALLHCTRPAFDHINNNHRGLTGPQIKDLKTVNDRVDEIFAMIHDMLQTRDFSRLDEVMEKRDSCFDLIADIIKNQIKRLQEDPEASNRGSALFFALLGETKTMVLQARNLIKSQAYFLNAVVESGDEDSETKK